MSSFITVAWQIAT